MKLGWSLSRRKQTECLWDTGRHKTILFNEHATDFQRVIEELNARDKHVNASVINRIESEIEESEIDESEIYESEIDESEEILGTFTKLFLHFIEFCTHVFEIFHVFGQRLIYILKKSKNKEDEEYLTERRRQSQTNKQDEAYHTVSSIIPSRLKKTIHSD